MYGPHPALSASPSLCSPAPRVLVVLLPTAERGPARADTRALAEHFVVEGWLLRPVFLDSGATRRALSAPRLRRATDGAAGVLNGVPALEPHLQAALSELRALGLLVLQLPAAGLWSSPRALLHVRQLPSKPLAPRPTPLRALLARQGSSAKLTLALWGSPGQQAQRLAVAALAGPPLRARCAARGVVLHLFDAQQALPPNTAPPLLRCAEQLRNAACIHLLLLSPDDDAPMAGADAALGAWLAELESERGPEMRDAPFQWLRRAPCDLAATELYLAQLLQFGAPPPPGPPAARHWPLDGVTGHPVQPDLASCPPILELGEPAAPPASSAEHSGGWSLPPRRGGHVLVFLARDTDVAVSGRFAELLSLLYAHPHVSLHPYDVPHDARRHPEALVTEALCQVWARLDAELPHVHALGSIAAKAPPPTQAEQAALAALSHLPLPHSLFSTSDCSRPEQLSLVAAMLRGTPRLLLLRHAPGAGATCLLASALLAARRAAHVQSAHAASRLVVAACFGGAAPPLRYAATARDVLARLCAQLTDELHGADSPSPPQPPVATLGEAQAALCALCRALASPSCRVTLLVDDAACVDDAKGVSWLPRAGEMSPWVQLVCCVRTHGAQAAHPARSLTEQAGYLAACGTMEEQGYCQTICLQALPLAQRRTLCQSVAQRSCCHALRSPALKTLVEQSDAGLPLYCTAATWLYLRDHAPPPSTLPALLDAVVARAQRQLRGFTQHLAPAMRPRVHAALMASVALPLCLAYQPLSWNELEGCALLCAARMSDIEGATLSSLLTMTLPHIVADLAPLIAATGSTFAPRCSHAREALERAWSVEDGAAGSNVMSVFFAPLPHRATSQHAIRWGVRYCLAAGEWRAATDALCHAAHVRARVEAGDVCALLAHLHDLLSFHASDANARGLEALHWHLALQRERSAAAACGGSQRRWWLCGDTQWPAASAQITGADPRAAGSFFDGPCAEELFGLTVVPSRVRQRKGDMVPMVPTPSPPPPSPRTDSAVCVEGACTPGALQAALGCAGGEAQLNLLLAPPLCAEEAAAAAALRARPHPCAPLSAHFSCWLARAVPPREAVALLARLRTLRHAFQSHVTHLHARPAALAQLLTGDDATSSSTAMAFAASETPPGCPLLLRPSQAPRIMPAPVMTLAGHPGGDVACASASPDGRHIASGSADGSLFLWDPHTGDRLASLSVHPDGAVRALRWHGATQIVTAGSDGVVAFTQLLPSPSPASGYQCTRMRTIRARAHAQGAASCLCSGGDVALSGDIDGLLHVWHSESHSLQCTLSAPFGAVAACAVHPSGSRIAGGGYGGALCVWRLCGQETSPDERSAMHKHPPALVCTLRGHTATVGAMAFSPCGHALASGCSDGAVALWAFRGGSPLAWADPPVSGGTPAGVNSLSFAPHGLLLLAAFSDGAMHIFAVSQTLLSASNATHAAAPQRMRACRCVRGLGGAVACASWMPDARQVLSVLRLSDGGAHGEQATVHLWECAGAPSGHASGAPGLVFTGDVLSTAGPSVAGTLVQPPSAPPFRSEWEARDERDEDAEDALHSGAVVALSCDPHGGALVVSVSDQEAALKLWLASASGLSPLPPLRAGGVLRCVSACGGTVLSGGEGGACYAWQDVGGSSSATPLSMCGMHSGGVLACALHTPHRAATAGTDGVLRLWHLPTLAADHPDATPSVVATLRSGRPSALRAMAWGGAHGPCADVIATGGAAHSVSLWSPTAAVHVMSLPLSGATHALAWQNGGGAAVLAAGGADGSLIVFDVRAPPAHPVLTRLRSPGAAPLHSLAFCDTQAAWVAAACGLAGTELYDLRMCRTPYDTSMDGTAAMVAQRTPVALSAITAVAWVGGEALLVGDSAGRVQHLRLSHA